MKRTKCIVCTLLILAMVCSLAGLSPVNTAKDSRAAMKYEYRMLEGEERFLPMTPIAESRGEYKSVKTNSDCLKVKLVKDAKNPGLQAQACYCYSRYSQTTTVATVYWYDKQGGVSFSYNYTKNSSNA